MKQLTVSEYEAGQRLDKLLQKLLKKAQKGFIYKMLRKKNITLNGKKAEGNEILKNGDLIAVYFSDETYALMTGGEEHGEKPQLPREKAEILYEDRNVIIFNKPAGMLSQKADSKDYSLVEYLRDYLLDSGQLTKEQMKTFRPGVCNRLDRNTSGLVIAGKTLYGLQAMSEILRERTLSKYYLCVVQGEVTGPMYLSSFLVKDEKENVVRIGEGPEGDRIETEYRPLAVTGAGTLLEVRLITGKSHQIRAHLAYIGHPIAGDTKYGNKEYNQMMKMRFGVHHQMLHAWRLCMPETCGISELAGKVVMAPVPAEFKHFQKAFGIELPKGE